MERPELLSEYFLRSNAADKHNHARQAILRLEKHWVVFNPYMRISTTLVGMAATDAWKAFKFSIDSTLKDKDLGVIAFVDRLAHDCIFNTYGKKEIGSPAKNLPTLQVAASRAVTIDSPAGNTRSQSFCPPVRYLDLEKNATATVCSGLTTEPNSSQKTPGRSTAKRAAEEAFGERNRCDARDAVTKKRVCRNAKSNLYCKTCNMGPFCRPTTGRTCWADHVGIYH